MAAEPPVAHDLYVHTARAAAGEAPRRARESSLEVLHYVDARLPVFRQMRLVVRVHRVRPEDLRHPRLKAALAGRGVTSLPALVTPNNIYLGVAAIGEVYEKNCREFSRWEAARNRRRPAPPLAPEDEVARFHRMEMGGGDGEETVGAGPMEDDDDAMGEGGGLMDNYRAMMSARSGAPSGGQGGRGSRAAAVPSQGSARAPPPIPPRADNLGPGGSAEDDFPGFLARLGGGGAAPRGGDGGDGGDGGGDEGDDGAMGGTSAQDDLMERAYWGNMEETLP
jgi:hypothetical protein